MNFAYYRLLHWLNLSYRFIPLMVVFFMSTSNVIISNSDTMRIFDSWFSFNGSSEENTASRVGTQNLLAEQAANQARSTRKKLELAGYEYHEKKTNVRNIDSFTP